MNETANTTDTGDSVTFDDLRRKVRERMVEDRIPIGTDDPTLIAMGAVPLSAPVDPKVCGDSMRHGGVPAFDFRRLSEYGVLWLVNRVVFHPRGFALSLVYEDGATEPRGWTIEGNGSEVWSFGGFDEDEKFAAVEGLLAQASEFGRAPHVGPDEQEIGSTS